MELLAVIVFLIGVSLMPAYVVGWGFHNRLKAALVGGVTGLATLVAITVTPVLILGPDTDPYADYGAWYWPMMFLIFFAAPVFILAVLAGWFGARR